MIKDMKSKSEVPQLREVETDSEVRRLFSVQSSTDPHKRYIVKRIKTIADTIIYRCECIGYVTRAKENPNFECRHIKLVKEELNEDRG